MHVSSHIRQHTIAICYIYARSYYSHDNCYAIVDVNIYTCMICTVEIYSTAMMGSNQVLYGYTIVELVPIILNNRHQGAEPSSLYIL